MTDPTTDPAAVEAAFLDALAGATPADRLAFAERACAGSPGLFGRVRELLRFHEEPRGPLDDLAPGIVHTPPGDERPGGTVGPYRLVEQIGEGGMGLVFVADQLHPVRRRVALKVIKPGMDTKQVVARFEAERQVLARMDHPNIAKVHDAGTTAAGRPFFVMELVHGVPINEFCDSHRLPVRDRLRLFVQVCHAVRHAHQKGVIHRDLKPSNVLVESPDGRPVPKVIDFGIAKATGEPPTERTLDTGYARMVGTPLYMSPEQAGAGGRDVDTRTDVYSLGVLLYELLTGTTPFDGGALAAAGFDEVRRVIREDEPPRPSARLSTLGPAARTSTAACRAVEPRHLGRAVRGDLDWIVMKCLEKDRDRRYETADGLARDVERFLADEPVEACPPSAGYRLRTFARRHRRRLATAAAFAAVVLAGGAVTAWQAVRLARAEREEVERAGAQAREQARRGREVAAALDRARERRDLAMARRAEALLEGANEPELAEQVQGLLAELVAEEADRRLAARLDEIRLLQAGVNVTENRFLRERAIPEYRQAFRDFGLPVGVKSPAEAAVLLRGRPPAVRVALIAALDEWLELTSRENPSEADWLGRVVSVADSDAWRRRVRVAREAADRPALEQLARDADAATQPPQALFLLDRALHSYGAREESVALLRRVQQAHPGDFWTNQNLGTALAEHHPPRLDEAVRFLTAAVALRPESPGARLNLGYALSNSGRLDEAIAACRKAVELKPDYAMAYTALGHFLWKAGRPGDAAVVYRKFVDLRPDSPEGHADLGGSLAEAGRTDESVAASRRAIALNPRLPQAHYYLGKALQADRRLDEAVAAFRRAIELKPDYAEAHCDLGVALELTGRPAAAVAAFRRAVGAKPDLFQAHFNLGITLADEGRLDEAVAALRAAAALPPGSAKAHYNLANTLRMQGRFDDAAAAYNRAIELKPDYAEAHCNLGVTLRRQAKFVPALAALTRGHELGSRRPDWSYASARWVEDCRRLMNLEGRLPAVLRGEDSPVDAGERNEFARLCFYKKLYAASARLRVEAFAADPQLTEDEEAGHRYGAACAAALAAAGRGADGERVSGPERDRWRKQALAWLRDDLAAKDRLIKTGKPEDRSRVRKQLRRWLYDPDLAGLREPAAAAGLPADERDGWKQLWAEVRALTTVSE